MLKSDWEFITFASPCYMYDTMTLLEIMALYSINRNPFYTWNLEASL